MKVINCLQIFVVCRGSYILKADKKIIFNEQTINLFDNYKCANIQKIIIPRPSCKAGILNQNLSTVYLNIFCIIWWPLIFLIRNTIHFYFQYHPHRQGRVDLKDLSELATTSSFLLIQSIGGSTSCSFHIIFIPVPNIFLCCHKRPLSCWCTFHSDLTNTITEPHVYPNSSRLWYSDPGVINF